MKKTLEMQEFPTQKGESFGPTYIVKIASYEGKDTIRAQETWDEAGKVTSSTLWVVIEITFSGARIVDDGYRSAEEAQSDWPDAALPGKDFFPDG